GWKGLPGSGGRNLNGWQKHNAMMAARAAFSCIGTLRLPNSGLAPTIAATRVSSSKNQVKLSNRISI
ncbi:MAG TPA: hypothetical protein PLC26_09805, partial [Bacillota bacterium]|nr:hypothetical protein [Bacillota bacterium]